ncbi:alpha-glucan family phosphorylase [Cellulomonas wangsupingiae]|uniref:alpha-glucan family phosphorylase n=1 Tax=Cellulomonas wangsupingiae TaxID=2968085 RepID=UPI001D0ED49F|nr:alpha-glucan family phosphorylase [Cellulomonas wangsupingiae]MCM0638428.1 alpha-glucan family phosphorylase [Cellulomonas wangsupingiae]
MRAIRRFTVRTVLPAALGDLDELAHNLRWSWHPATRAVFADVDPALWQQVAGDPVAFLGALDRARLDALAADPQEVARVQAAAADLHTYLEQPRWYQRQTGTGLPASIAYFSPEFGIAAALPQYSGGLGVLAGDHLKAASDLGVPVVGVGLLYRAGYFRQALDRTGRQTETYPVLDPDGLPLTLLREADGTPARVTLALPGGRALHAHVRVAQVGRVPLLLLDSDVPDNDDAARAVTDRLYGGAGPHRLEQELLLGVGGVRALRAYTRLTGTPAPEVHHMNEGHAGFLGVERIRELVADGASFGTALELVRATTVFTTHTPVPAGIDRFETRVVEQYVAALDEKGDLPVDDVVALGTEDHEGGDPLLFNMAVMALRLTGRANGVSRLHGRVSREMFAPLWPGFDPQEVPIGSITNGVHAPTWVAPELTALASRRMSAHDLATGAGWDAAGTVSDAELWGLRRRLREGLVDDVRRRVRASWRGRGAPAADLHWIDDALSPDVLTIGFARRVPTYKRLTLMLADPERLEALLLDPLRPVQLVVAGKAHPADEPGKRLVAELVAFADQHHVRHRVVFLPDYDMRMAATLYPGCDVWLNNPLRPLEACGTSGMKVALNGGLNLSVLDGWWDEWHDEGNGWVIPTVDGVDDPGARDAAEAAALYDVLEQQVVPTFYDRDPADVPRRWLAMVRHTLATLGPKVQATRMVADYVAHLYVPAAAAGASLGADDLSGAAALAAWKERVRAAWPQVRVDHVDSGGVTGPAQVGDRLHVQAWVALGDLSPDDVEVQVVHGPVGPDDEIERFEVDALTLGDAYEADRYGYEGEVELTSTGPFGYTVRVVPRHEALTSVAATGLVATAT